MSTLKFSIIVPVLNGRNYIEDSLRSILSQCGDFNIECIVMDGGSTDGTQELVRDYIEGINCGEYKVGCEGIDLALHSDADRGMYDAVAKGFQVASGDIYAWLNADDVYLPGAFSIVAASFSKYSDVKWLKGITSYINDQGESDGSGRCNLYTREWIQKGYYGRELYFIQQDSVFWRSELWAKVGNIPLEYRLAGDYYLWLEFSKHEPLYSLNYHVSNFRHVNGQLSENMALYQHEVRSISTAHPFSGFLARLYFRFFSNNNGFARLLCRLLFDGHQYQAITLRGEKLTLVSGDYFTVKNQL